MYSVNTGNILSYYCLFKDSLSIRHSYTFLLKYPEIKSMANFPRCSFHVKFALNCALPKVTLYSYGLDLFV